MRLFIDVYGFVKFFVIQLNQQVSNFSEKWFLDSSVSRWKNVENDCIRVSIVIFFGFIVLRSNLKLILYVFKDFLQFKALNDNNETSIDNVSQILNFERRYKIFLIFVSIPLLKVLKVLISHCCLTVHRKEETSFIFQTNSLSITRETKCVNAFCNTTVANIWKIKANSKSQSGRHREIFECVDSVLFQFISQSHLPCYAS